MQTTLNLDDSLFTQASAAAGIDQPSQLIHFALRVLINQTPKKTPATGKSSAPFVITGPFAESNPAVCRSRTASEILGELDDEAFLDLQARTARGESL